MIYIYTELEAHNGELIGLGITPDIQTELPIEVYEKNPVIMAEWVAGQLIEQTGQRVVAESTARSITEEFSEFQSGRIRVLPENLPDRLTSFFDMEVFTSGMCGWLGVTDQELSEFWWVKRNE